MFLLSVLSQVSFIFHSHCRGVVFARPAGRLLPAGLALRSGAGAVVLPGGLPRLPTRERFQRTSTPENQTTPAGDACELPLRLFHSFNKGQLCFLLLCHSAGSQKIFFINIPVNSVCEGFFLRQAFCGRLWQTFVYYEIFVVSAFVSFPLQTSLVGSCGIRSFVVLSH